MRVLLDECLPRRFARLLLGREVLTVPQVGWAGLKNGELLRKIDGAFDAFVTVDANLQVQQRLEAIGFRLVVIRARTNRYADVAILADSVLRALEANAPGQVVIVAQPEHPNP